MAARVLKRMAFAFPVFKIDKLESVIPTLADSSFNDIFFFAIITSKLTIIGIFYMVNSFSDWISKPRLKIRETVNNTPAMNSSSVPLPRLRSIKS